MVQFSKWMSVNPEILVFVGVFALTYLTACRLFGNKTKMRFPPTVGCLPVIGSLPYLPKISHLHRWSLEKSYTLGGVFSFQIGNKLSVMLTSHEAIREAFVQRSHDYADRMVHFSNGIVNPRAKGIVFHLYDEEFKKQQQISLSILKEFGFGQKQTMEARIGMEVEDLLKRITAENSDPFSPLEMISCSVVNVIGRIMFGQPMSYTSEKDQRLVEVSRKLPVDIGGMMPLDYIPWLQFVPHFRNLISNAKLNQHEFFDLVDCKLKASLNPELEENFVNKFVQKQGDGFVQEDLNYIIRDIVVAGSDTVSTTLTWAIILMANRQDIQTRLQNDIDAVVERGRLPSVTDMSKLAYVEATILELMRYRTIAPVGMPHATKCDTEVGGFFIPKNTQVISVIYAAHMNVNVWTDPDVFRPDRFLDAEGRVINKDLMIGFSLGKRACLGEVLARQEVYMFFTSLLQHFDIRPPEGVSEISTSEEFELLFAPAPFKVRFLPRKQLELN